MNLHEAAIYYAELGYPVFPCRAGEKKPATANGFYAATTDRDQIDAWWTANPKYNIAIPTHGLLVLDADSGNRWLTPDKAAALMDSECPQATTPRGGRHYWFRQPEGASLRCTESQIAPKIDTRANGGYVVVAPSETEAGNYDFPVPLSPLSALPDIPGWLMGELDRASKRGEINPRAGDTDGEIIEGNPSRDVALFRIACCDREIGKTEDEIVAGLIAINRNRVKPPLDESIVRQKARSAARYEPSQIRMAFAQGWDCSIDISDFIRKTEDRNKEPDDDFDPDALEPDDPGPFPEHLLDVPGFISEVIDFNLCGAHRRQPALAMAGAIALTATVIGHRLRDVTGVRSNVYIISVAKTGRGKDRSRVVNRQILSAAHQDEKLLGPEDFTSGAALCRYIAEARPVTLLQCDEMGRMLRACGNADRNPAQFAIVTDLLKLYSSAGSTYVSKAYADPKNNIRIENPCVVLYGTTTPDAFFASLSHDSIHDGFLSRTMIIEGDDTPEWLTPVHSDGVPLHLAEFVKEWRDRFVGDGNINPTMTVPETDEAARVFMAFDRRCQSIITSGSETAEAVWVRAGEKARKLALIYAASASVSPAETAVDERAAIWGTEVSAYLSQRLLWLCSDRLANGEYEASRNSVRRYIRESGPEGVTRRQIQRRFRGIRPKALTELLESLLDAGDTIQKNRDTNSRGRPKIVFVSGTCPKFPGHKSGEEKQ